MRNDKQQNQSDSVSAPPSLTLFQSLHLSNILSFGPDTPETLLQALNILIGPNGSGKSNFVEVISLLRATATNLEFAIIMAGGPREVVWKGNSNADARISANLRGPNNGSVLTHKFHFNGYGHPFLFGGEKISDDLNFSYPASDYYSHELGYETQVSVKGQSKKLNQSLFDGNDSILSQLRDPEQYPEISYLADIYSRIRIYREWQFGRSAVFRVPQRADMRNDRLEEDFSNLGLFLNRLRQNPAAKKAILTHLRDLYDGIDDFDVSVVGGTVQVFFTEGNFTIPATRLSDGTLRYLCLLAILCDPTPPPLICIEEPELGLHPDIIPKIADLLVEASTRTQLIVTTHSDILVDAMTERPESVLVCEKHEGQTRMTRLSAADLAEWLKTYRLGQLWMRGDIGGTRW